MWFTLLIQDDVAEHKRLLICVKLGFPSSDQFPTHKGSTKVGFLGFSRELARLVGFS